MSNQTIGLDESLYAYMLAVSLREPEILAELRRETLAMPHASMQIAPEQGQFMAMLVKVTGAKRILEVGTFTGYSALVMALALPPGGRIVACDVSEEWTRTARRYWSRAGVAERIDLRLGAAASTLDALIGAGETGTFDFAFIDADKENYRTYYERALELLRPGGLVAIDNTLWGGSVIDPTKTDADTEAIRAFNIALHADPRVDLSLVPIGDGLSLARKCETALA